MFDSNAIDLLSKGKSYTPHLPNNPADLNCEIATITRNVKFAHHFFNLTESEAFVKPAFIEYIKSRNDPPDSTNERFENSIQFFEKEFPTCNANNVSFFKTGDYLTICNIKSYKDIRYCYADKGGCLVIMKKSDYNEMVMKHLNDLTTYIMIEGSVDETIHQRICDIVESYRPIFSSVEYNYFTHHKSRSSSFYVLPKIHKSGSLKIYCDNLQGNYLWLKKMLPDIPSRPIVNNVNSPTSRISHFIAKLLTPILPLTLGYIKDSFDFITKLNKQFSVETVFLTIDVVSLYTIIPHEYGIEAIHYWANRYRSKIRDVPLTLILDFLSVILKNNTFTYNRKYYYQRSGTAMGTKCAPVYANLVMSYLELQIFEKCKNKFGNEITESIKKNYFRYLDDILLYGKLVLATFMN
jgi:hypothetical protein